MSRAQELIDAKVKGEEVDLDEAPSKTKKRKYSVTVEELIVDKRWVARLEIPVAKFSAAETGDSGWKALSRLADTCKHVGVLE